MRKQWLMCMVVLGSMALAGCGGLIGTEADFVGGEVEVVTVLWDEKLVKVPSSDPAYEAIRKAAEASVTSADGMCKCGSESSEDLIKHYKRAVLVELQEQVNLNMPIQSGRSAEQPVEMVLIPLDVDRNVVAVGQESRLSRYMTNEDAVADLKKAAASLIQ